MAAAAAAFATIDQNHDGVIDQSEFAAAVAPVVVEEVVAAPATYVIQPTTIAQPYTVSYAQPATYTLPATYTVGESISYAQPQTFTVGETTSVLTLSPGTRVVYTARHDSSEYPGVIQERNAAGWLLKLDIDGGVKEVMDSEMWRVTLETETPTAPAPAAPVKEKKSKKVKSSKKGCC